MVLRAITFQNVGNPSVMEENAVDSSNPTAPPIIGDYGGGRSEAKMSGKETTVFELGEADAHSRIVLSTFGWR